MKSNSRKKTTKRYFSFLLLAFFFILFVFSGKNTGQMLSEKSTILLLSISFALGFRVWKKWKHLMPKSTGYHTLVITTSVLLINGVIFLLQKNSHDAYSIYAYIVAMVFGALAE